MSPLPISRSKTSTAIFGAIALVALVGTWVVLKDDGSAPLSAAYDTTIEADLKRARTLRSAGQAKDAFDILKVHARSGYPSALLQLGRAHMRGWGTPIDLDASRDALLLAVEYDFPARGEAAYELGRLYQRSVGEDCNALAVSWFDRAREWGYAKAHLQLATHFERGLGTDRDLDKALQHYEAAAAFGSEAAAIKFARILKRGDAGIPADPKRAHALAMVALASLEDKARSGSGSASKILGRLYRDGDFVDMDIRIARRWLQRSSELGDPGGMHDLARLILATETDTTQVRRALAWMRRAVSLGHGGAMTAIGRYHLAGQYGLARENAVIWFERGVDAKHAGAMAELARLYATGDLVPRDIKKAIELAKQGVELGHRGSQTLLSDLRLRRDTVSSNERFVRPDMSKLGSAFTFPPTQMQP